MYVVEATKQAHYWPNEILVQPTEGVKGVGKFSPTLLVGKDFNLFIRWPLLIHLNHMGQGNYDKCTSGKLYVYSACARVNIRD
jgi:hypothetical protein